MVLQGGQRSCSQEHETFSISKKVFISQGSLLHPATEYLAAGGAPSHRCLDMQCCEILVYLLREGGSWCTCWGSCRGQAVLLCGRGRALRTCLAVCCRDLHESPSGLHCCWLNRHRQSLLPVLKPDKIPIGKGRTQTVSRGSCIIGEGRL